VGSVDGSILKIIPESFTEDVWFKIIITGACEPAWANAEESNLFFLTNETRSTALERQC
jgi:hypothetical protein